MYKLPPVVVSIIAMAAGVATALLSSVHGVVWDVCVGIIAAAGTFGIGHSQPNDANSNTTSTPDPYLSNDK